MRRFVVERSFPHGLVVPLDEVGRRMCASIVAVNAVCAVTWICSYVHVNGRKTWCLYEGPTEEAIRDAADRNGLPATRITEVWRLPPGAVSC